MLNSIKRTPQIPRKIRDIRPKRQLARNRESETNQLQQQDDDWWRRAETADELTHFWGDSAVNLVNRSSKTIPSKNANPSATDNISDKLHYGIFNKLKQLHGNIRHNRKKLFWGLMVIISWRTIYLLDLEKFTNAEEEQKAHESYSIPHDVRMKSIEDEISLLNEITDDMLTSTVSKSSSIGGPEKHSFENSYKHPSLPAALRHLHSPPHETDSLNSQNHRRSFLNNQIPTPYNDIFSKAHGTTAGLDCSDYGGPFGPSESAELVYWRDFPTDASFTSPFYNAQAQEATTGSIWNTKYLTFEMDVSYLFQIHFCPDLGHHVRAFIVLMCSIPLYRMRAGII